jgi:hypothetical protein
LAAALGPAKYMDLLPTSSWVAYVQGRARLMGQRRLRSPGHMEQRTEKALSIPHRRHVAAQPGIETEAAPAACSANKNMMIARNM